MFDIDVRYFANELKNLNKGRRKGNQLSGEAAVLTVNKDKGVYIGIYSTLGTCYRLPVKLLDKDSVYYTEEPIVDVKMSCPASVLTQIVSLLAEDNTACRSAMKVSPLADGGIRLEGGYGDYLFELYGVLKTDELKTNDLNTVVFHSDIELIKHIEKNAKLLKSKGSKHVSGLQGYLHNGLFLSFDKNSITIIGGDLTGFQKIVIPNKSEIKEGCYWVLFDEYKKAMQQASNTGKSKIEMEVSSEEDIKRYYNSINNFFAKCNYADGDSYKDIPFDSEGFKNAFELKTIEYLATFPLKERKKRECILKASIKLDVKSGKMEVIGFSTATGYTCSLSSTKDTIYFVVNANAFRALLNCNFGKNIVPLASIKKQNYLTLAAYNQNYYSGITIPV